MKSLSLRQPWAWAVVHGGKCIEAAAERDALRARVAKLEGAIRAAALDEYAPPNDGPRCGICSSLLVVCDKWNTGKDSRCAGPRLRAALKEV